MVQGMAFLSKKGFNPHNNANRKQVWEAQQESKLETERLRKRQEQLKREQEDAELELATRGEIGGSQAQLRFMYDAPPGMENKNDAATDTTTTSSTPNNRDSLGNNNDVNDLSRVKPGDDAAAVAFRQMLAGFAAKETQEEPVGNSDEQDRAKTFHFTPTLQGSMVEADSRYNNNNNTGDSGNPNNINNNNKNNSKPPPILDSRSALEKEVGRKNRSTQNNLSYEQQIERFPQLKNAPMAVKRGDNSKETNSSNSNSTMMVHFKPLGAQILHVRCLACGIWGHAKGDRECKKSGWNPFAMPTSSSNSSSILPKPKSGDSEKRRKENPPRKRRYDSDSDNESHNRRRHHSSRHRTRRDYCDDSDSEDSSRRRKHKEHRRRRRKHRYKEHYDDSSDYETSNSDPSSEDSSKLKRRNDDRYDDSDQDERRRHRKKSREKHRDRKTSKKRSSKRYESSSSHRKKKKKRRDSSSP